MSRIIASFSLVLTFSVGLIGSTPLVVENAHAEDHNSSAFGLTKEKVNPDKTKGKPRTLEGDRSGEKRGLKKGKSGKDRLLSGAVESSVVAPTKHLVVIALDSSRSFKRADPRGLRYQSAKLFVRFLNEGDRVAVLSFDKEAKTVLPLTLVSGSNLSEIDSAIDNVSTEGGFSDLELPLSAALQILDEDASVNTRKSVVLLSDGGMDPPPSRGTTEAVTKTLFDELLPKYRSQDVHVYTPILSEDSDKAILTKVAEETLGQSWLAPDVDSIHRRLSELFLTLNQSLSEVKPEGEAFEILPKSREATFVVSDANEVSFVNPKGGIVSNLSLPAGVRWFKGEHIDIVTLKDPLPGAWKVHGVPDVQKQVRFLKNLEVQVRWPEGEITVNHPFSIAARLVDTEAGELPENIRHYLRYNFKIVNTDDGEVVQQGALELGAPKKTPGATKSEHGEDGEESKSDSHEDDSGIFSTKITLAQSGNFTAVLLLDGPTFSRVEEHEFSISSSPITLERKEEDSFLHEAERFEVRISKEIQILSGLKVQLVAKLDGKDRAFLYSMKSSKEEPGLYTFKTEELLKGKYELVARATGVDEKKGKRREESSMVPYTSRKGLAATDENMSALELEGEAEEAMSRGILVSIGTVFVSILLCVFFVFRSARLVGSSVQLPQYVIAPALQTKLEEFRTKSSPRKREPTEKDFEEFSLVRQALKARTTLTEAVEAEPAPAAESTGAGAEAPDAAPAESANAEAKPEAPPPAH